MTEEKGVTARKLEICTVQLNSLVLSEFRTLQPVSLLDVITLVEFDGECQRLMVKILD